MLPVKTIVRRVRTIVHDKDKITYSDDEIVDVINAAVRFIRRTIADNRPEFISSVKAGTLDAGENLVELDDRPLIFVRVLAGSHIDTYKKYKTSAKIWNNHEKIFNNKRKIFSEVEETTYKQCLLTETNAAEIEYVPDVGSPEVYYRTGWTGLSFYPIPHETTGYTIEYVPDIKELTMDDDSPLLNEFDDLVIEYAQIRLSVGNEYDVSQDNQIMGSIYSQVIDMLHIPPTGTILDGYWDTPMRYGGYGNHKRRSW